MGKRWVFWSLFAMVLALVGASVVTQVRRAGGAGARGAQDVTMVAKMAFAASRFSGAGEAYERTLLERLDAASTSGPAAERARALRRKAIWCSLRGLGCAAGALDALDRIGAEERRPAPADEVALLREVLAGERIEAERAAALEARLEELRLGWFDHLLRERLYRHAGETARAEAALDAAQRGAMIAMAAGVLILGLLGGGLLAWAALLLSPRRAAIVARIREGLRRPEEAPGADEGSTPEARPDAPARQMAVVVAFFAASLALPLAVGPLALAGSPGPAARAGWTLALEGALLLLVGVAHLVFLRPAGLGLGFGRGREGRGPALRALGVGALGYLLMWPVLVVVMTPLGELFERLGLPTQGHPIVEQLQGAARDPGALALWVVIAAVAAPLLEEAVFRGALHKAIHARLGGKAALVLVPVVFAVVHPQIGLGLVGVLVVGITLSLVRIHEGSLWASVVLHALNNGVALLLAMGMLAG